MRGELTSRVMSSSTMRFCKGTRPVLAPDEMHRAPVLVIELGPTLGSGEFMCSGSIANSYSSPTLEKKKSTNVKTRKTERRTE